MRIFPLPGFIQIKPDEFEKKTGSGLFIEGDRGVGEPMSATVLAVGKKVKHVERGDRIFYSLAKAREIMTKDGNEKFYFIKEEDIVAKISD